ncbi:MAG: hypothetical protein KC776_19420 [Myxococcales bacterium]|nr:hypothetical protein [Myxococcales bacterium]MCB9576152.1 hypothetical protein [Polyangiaceae bacterium]
MTIDTEERERPSEWLRRLREERHLYRRLLADAGSISLAAHRLAQARCRVQPVSFAIPTVAELRVAADEIALNVGAKLTPVTEQLLQDCEAAGLAVILPLSAPHAA